MNYRANGGHLTYWKWIESNYPDANKENSILPCTKIDKSGKLIVETSRGVIDTGEIPCKKKYLVKFYCDNQCIMEKETRFGEKIEEPNFGALKVKGWYLRKDFSEPFDFGSTRIIESIDLYADYETGNSLVTFFDQTTHFPFEKAVISFGKEYRLPLPIDYHSQYRFLSWQYEGKNIREFGNWFIPYKQVTLIAKWEKKKPFDAFSFGYYPQSVVSDESLIKKIESEGKKVWTDRSSYFIEYKGYRYRRKSRNYSYAGLSNTYFLDKKTKIVLGKEYYFRVEPLRWKLYPLLKGGNEYIALTERVIDIHFYAWSVENAPPIPNSYEDSQFRGWLNSVKKSEYKGKGDYGNSGITDTDLILNSQELSLLRPHFKNKDKFFLLSKEECERYLPKQDLNAEATDFTLSYNELLPSLDNKRVSWATRTPSSNNQYFMSVNSNGEMKEEKIYKYCGVRFAVKVTLNKESISK